MEFISEANFDVNALRGGKWSLVRIDAEGPVDGQGKALANLLASGNEAGFWQEALRHLEAAEVLEPFAFDLVVETGRSLPMEAVRLPPEQDGGTTLLIREAERQRTVLGAAAFGQTPGQLIEELRLRHARTLLETGAVESVAAAAAAVGLSASYFSLRFRVSFNQTAKSFLAVKSPPSLGAST